jgi:3-isopropylmalate/(R)-2-methylmalate dehydratase small subunit
MQPFMQHQGLVATLDRANVDTDQIIPKQFLKRIERTGFGQFLFFDWRFTDDGVENPAFELNQPAARGASILLTRRNFGSGSSREHAVWALGLRFSRDHRPLVRRHLLQQLFQERQHAPYTLTVDLEACKITDDFGLSLGFEVQAFRRHCLLNGLDDIGLTLEHEDKITAYEQAHGIAS